MLAHFMTMTGQVFLNKVLCPNTVVSSEPQYTCFIHYPYLDNVQKMNSYRFSYSLSKRDLQNCLQLTCRKGHATHKQVILTNRV